MTRLIPSSPQSIRPRIAAFLIGLTVAATASTQDADAGGLGLFNRSACDTGCAADLGDVMPCDSDCGSPLCCDATDCGSVGCDGCISGCDTGLLGGLIKPSDRCFDDFVSPMINFVHFEDPRTVTELRPIFVNHWVPERIGNNIPAGGTIQVLAMQFRIALTERLSLIGTKDGYIWDNTNGALDTLLDDGWASVVAGLKYNLLRDTQSGTIASIGGTYDLPGSRDSLQDVADGEFHLFATGGQRLMGGNAHLMSAFGWRVPSDGFLQSESIHWSNHFDLKLTEKTYFVTEVAWWHWIDSAEGGAALGVAGQDLFNLSTSDVTGNDLVTQNVGLKFKPNGKTEWGIAYEFPLTEFKDVIEGRLQTELIVRY
ncbi:hypothetical protein [Stieleria mannarensis]|uniref:hypothetical protein n=1 Tax=Stieleria mannarensis TaxID=2755585 RepID=UPI002570EA19|nr:hypothetical protein [Rhodopirellula sp. JC639]